MCGIVDAAEDQRPAGRPARAMSQPSPMRRAAARRGCVRLPRVAQQRARPARSRSGQVTLKFSGDAEHQLRRRPIASIALASSVTLGAGARQRVARARRGGTSAASAPATCRRAVDASRRDAPVALALQRVGHRQREQAADRVVAGRRRSGASIHAGAHQAARRVVHQHPVVGARRRASASAARPLAHGRARASRRRSARPQRAPAKPAHGRSNCRVVRARARPAIRLEPRHARPAPPACARPAAAPAISTYCFGPAAPARAPRRHTARAHTARRLAARSAWLSIAAAANL